LANSSTEFCQGRNIEQPEYSIYELGPQRFGATCTFLSQTHHDQNAAFSSKKVAKTSAARAAVLALREEGLLAKRNTNVHSVVAPAIPAFGAPLPIPIPAPAVNTPSIASTPKVIPTPLPPSAPSASSQIPILCTSLNITPPTYKLTQSSPLTPDFWDGEARFEYAIEPCLRGAVGKVEKVWGKKNAKDQVVQRVLEVLEGVKLKRMDG
jgi:hypothetical protein